MQHRISRANALAALLAAPGCAPEIEPCVYPAPFAGIGSGQLGPEPSVGSLGHLVPRDPCELRPHLCGLPVDSRWAEHDTAKSIDIVFVGDGYPADELESYRSVVERLVAEVKRDAIVWRRPALFNFHRIDLASETSRITNGDTEDTALGGCLERDGSGITDDWFLHTLGDFWTVTRNAPDVDVLVTILNVEIGRASASLEVLTNPSRFPGNAAILLGREDTGRTLTHELGHALFALQDEYSDTDAPFPESAFPFTSTDPFLASPNVSLEPSGSKWAPLVSGARRGGLRYGAGVYHPTDSCRMLAMAHDDFCAVCGARIEEVLRIFEDPIQNDGPPECGLRLGQAPDSVSGTLETEIFGFDLNGLRLERFAIDGRAFPHECGPCPQEAPEWLRDGGIRASEDPSMEGPSLREIGCLLSCFRFDSRLLVGFPPGSIDTSTMTPGTHELSLECVDRLGLDAEVTVPFRVRGPAERGP